MLGQLSVIWQHNEVSSEMQFQNRLPGLTNELPSGHKLILLGGNLGTTAAHRDIST